MISPSIRRVLAKCSVVGLISTAAFEPRPASAQDPFHAPIKTTRDSKRLMVGNSGQERSPSRYDWGVGNELGGFPGGKHSLLNHQASVSTVTTIVLSRPPRFGAVGPGPGPSPVPQVDFAPAEEPPQGAPSVGPPRASPQPGPQVDFAPVKDAIGNLKGLRASVEKVLTVIRATNFGPFKISGSCGYDPQWWAFGMDTKTWNWWWEFPNYTWLRNDLERRYQAVLAVDSQFNQRFSPLKTWLVTTLPQFSQQFDEASARIQNDQDAIKNATTTQSGGLIIPAQRKIDLAKNDILRTITQLNDSLQTGSDQLRSAQSSLSTFNQQLNGAIQQVSSGRNGMEQMIARDDTTFYKTGVPGKIGPVGDWPCDANSGRAGYENIKKTVRDQFQSVVNAGQNFGVDSRKTDQAVSTILGTVLNLRTGYQGVLDNLKAAEITPAGAVQKLRLNVASAAWRDLADYARQQFP